MNQKYICCNTSNIKSQNISKLSVILKLTAEETRLKILCILTDGQHCVCELMEHVSLSQSLISHHLKDLKDAGMVIDEKRGLRAYYSLTDQGKYITNLLFNIPNKEVFSK